MRRNEAFLGCGCRRFSPARRSNGGRVLARTMDRLQRYPVQVSSLRNFYETYGYAVELAVEITEVYCSDRFAAPVDVALLTVRPLGDVVDVVEGPDELFSEVVERVLVISRCLVVAVPEDVVDRLVAFDRGGELGLKKGSHLTRSLATEVDGGTSGSDTLELWHWQRMRDASRWRLETIFEREALDALLECGSGWSRTGRHHWLASRDSGLAIGGSATAATAFAFLSFDLVDLALNWEVPVEPSVASGYGTVVLDALGLADHDDALERH